MAHIVKEIADNEIGAKWIVYIEHGMYMFDYYERFTGIGWRLISSERNYSREAIEDMLGIAI